MPWYFYEPNVVIRGTSLWTFRSKSRKIPEPSKRMKKDYHAVYNKRLIKDQYKAGPCCQEVLVWGCTTPQKKIAREGSNFRSNSCTWLMKLTRYFLIRSCISFFQESFRVFNKRLQSVMSTNQGPRNRGAQRHGTPDFLKTRKCAHFS